MARITFAARRLNRGVKVIVLILAAFVFSSQTTPGQAQAPKLAPIFPEYEYDDGDRARRYQFSPPTINPEYDTHILNPRNDPRNKSFLAILKEANREQKKYIKQRIHEGAINALNRGDIYEARWLLYVNGLIGD